MLDEKLLAEKKEKLIKEMKMFEAIKSKEVEKAFFEINRETFFSTNKEAAYVDNAFPIGFGQTISQPSTIAIMLEFLQVKKGMKILEVGSGCGYVSALLSKLVGTEGKVFGIELIRQLADISKANLEIEEIKNVKIKSGDGKKGWPEEKPFDRILISAAAKDFPKELIEQLADNGRMVAPIGAGQSQMLQVLKKNEKSMIKRETSAGQYVFVPLK